MATWHQLQAGPKRLYHETEWTVVEDPPNDTRTLSTFSTEPKAIEYLNRIKVLRPNVPAYILQPGKGSGVVMRIVEANETRSTGPRYDAWPASLPQISYVTADGGFLCVTCANGGNGSLASAQSDDPQWGIIGAQVNAGITECAHCGRGIKGSERLS